MDVVVPRSVERGEIRTKKTAWAKARHKPGQSAAPPRVFVARLEEPEAALRSAIGLCVFYAGALTGAVTGGADPMVFCNGADSIFFPYVLTLGVTRLVSTGP